MVDDVEMVKDGGGGNIQRWRRRSSDMEKTNSCVQKVQSFKIFTDIRTESLGVGRTWTHLGLKEL